MEKSLFAENEWLQIAVTQLSPMFNEFASDVLNNAVQPLIQGALKDAVRKSYSGQVLPSDFHFIKTNLGTVAPIISNLETNTSEDNVDKEGNRKSVVIDFNMDYLGDCDLQVKLMGFRSGVKDVKLSGRVRIVLGPTSGNQIPFIGGIQGYFLDKPSFDFDLEGVADVCDWTIFRRKVREILTSKLTEKCVFPNKFLIPMIGSSMDPMKVKCFQPNGVYGIRIVGASDLPRKRGIRSLVNQDKPDTYIEVTLGANTYTTKVIKNTTEPVWDCQWFNYLLENGISGHTVRMDVYDEDSFSKDDYLGKVVYRIDQQPYDGKDISVYLENDDMQDGSKHPEQVSGHVTFCARWLPLIQKLEEDPTEADVKVGIVTVFIYSCNNLVEYANGSPVPGEDGIPANVQINVTATYSYEMSLKSEEMKNTMHPNFEQGFTFYYTGNNWKKSVVKIRAIETESGSSFGQHQLSAIDLVNNPINRKLFSLNQDKPMITITMSAKIEFAI